MKPYCTSRFTTVRRPTREVRVGPVGIGGDNPLRVQSMTTTPTLDVEATVRQCIDLAEAGCEIVRVTAQNVKAAAALRAIRTRFAAAGFAETPLVADIHFLPAAAMEAVQWVEKVRINPGNYADKKKFAQREYSDSEYDEEIARLYEAFSPIVLRCRDLGRAMRIGTNHGSLSDRIMNRYGDTPLGMVESALEFLRIAESHGFRDIVLSMKASNPKVMIQAYRLMVAKMAEEDMHYPLHLGVTEAGDGDDARIKSAIGIGSLLQDGLGDTIRVSLTEDPVAEIPVARSLAEKAMALWHDTPARTTPDPVDPFAYRRREIETVTVGRSCRMGPLDPPLVLQPAPLPVSHGPRAVAEAVAPLQNALRDARIEGLLLDFSVETEFPAFASFAHALEDHVDFLAWELSPELARRLLAQRWEGAARDILVVALGAEDGDLLRDLLSFAEAHDLVLAPALTPEGAAELRAELAGAPAERLLLTLDGGASEDGIHPLGRYRQLAEVAQGLGLNAPLWIRNTRATNPHARAYFGDQLLEASILSGALLCDGMGDAISVETVADAQQAVTLAYNILQGARARTTKTEYVACPSCGRTLFDLQTTTQRI
ncbi:MAG: (E)-4-hydroxy-3-methylbut-2-enyl-diphosphate synthase, partial [Opitutales bacterium]